MKFFRYWHNRLSHPIRGVFHGLKNDSAIQIQALGGIAALLALHFVFGPFSNEANLLLAFSYLFVLVTEFQNSAVETALDRIHPERHHEIGRSKDLAAAAVLCAAVFGLISVAFILTGRI